MQFADWFTVDWDTYYVKIDVPAQLEKIHGLLEREFGLHGFSIEYRSSSRRGVHVLVKVSRKLSTTRRFYLRQECGDDESRLSWDLTRTHGDAIYDYSKGVLYDAKEIPYGKVPHFPGEWKHYEKVDV